MARLIEHHELALPGLIEQADGLRLLVISDLHARRPRPRHERLIDELRDAEVDLLVFVGDLMHGNGDEPIAHELAGRIVEAAQPRLGAVGVHGNHDSPALRRRLRHVPVRWLDNSVTTFDEPPITCIGLACSERERRGGARGDLLAAMLSDEIAVRARRLRLVLSHMPDFFTAAADAGVDLFIAGHTHGGQMRLPGCGPLVTQAIDWPARHGSGVIALKSTRGVISRGLGESVAEGLRLCCPPHAPLLTLRRAEEGTPRFERITTTRRW